jgi:tetratricopeptide (TPR) repeat protein
MLNELEQALGTLLTEPTRADIFAFCEAEFVAGGNWQELIGLYETFGASFGSDGQPNWAGLIAQLESMAASLPVEERSQLFETIGQLWEARLGRPEQALRQYQAAFKLWPKNRAALARARGIYAGQGNWRLVTRLLELELHAVTEPLVQAELLVALGEAALDGGPDAERALGYLERAAQLAPTFEGVGGLASRLAALPAEVMAAQPPAEAHEAAVEAVRAPAEPVVSAGPVAAAVETEPKLKWKLSPALSALRSAASGEAVSAVRRARRTDAGALEGLDRAALETLWAAGEDDLGVLEALAKRYREVGDLVTLAARYESAVKALVWQESAKELMIDAGRLYWRELGDMEAAERMFKRVRLLDGREVTTLTFFAELARRAGEPRRLLTALQSLRDATVEQVSWLEVSEELASLSAMDARTHDKAVEVWRQILRRSPHHAVARSGLQELLTTSGRWSTLLEVLKDDLALATEVEDQVRILESVVEVYRDRLNLPFMVAQTLQSI